MTLMVQLRTLASTMLIPFSWLLGSWSDHYYDRYERALDKLTKRIAAHKAQQRKQQQTHTRWMWVSALFALGALCTASARKQLAESQGIHTWSPFLFGATAFVLWFSGWYVLQGYSGWRQRSIARKMQRDQKQLAKLINDLKDGSHYDRVERLLRLYDPSYRPPQSSVKSMQGDGRGRILASQNSKGTPNTPSRVSGFAGAVVGALGSTVEGLANQLTLPADVTAMDALRAAQLEASALRGQVAYWQQLAFHCRDVVDRQQREINGYRAQLGLEPAQEPPGTPLQVTWSAEQGGEGVVHDAHKGATIVEDVDDGDVDGSGNDAPSCTEQQPVVHDMVRKDDTEEEEEAPAVLRARRRKTTS